MNPARVTIPNEPISFKKQRSRSFLRSDRGRFNGRRGNAVCPFSGRSLAPDEAGGGNISRRGAIGPGFRFGPVFLGLALHLTLSVALGVFFVWLGGYLSVGGDRLGVIFSLSIWVIMQFGLLPVMNPWLAAAPPIPLRWPISPLESAWESIPVF